MLARDQRKRVEIPHERGQWMELRPLPWPLLEAARAAKTRAAMAMMAELPEEARRSVTATPAAVPQQIEPENAYDRGIVLRAGIVAWSYEPPFSPELIDELDEQTAAWAFGEILAPALPKSESERIDALVPFPST